MTSVDFYPEEEAYFISGCMDRKLRVWSIPQGCVLKWTQAPSVITTVTFCPGGRLCAAGLSDRAGHLLLQRRAAVLHTGGCGGGV